MTHTVALGGYDASRDMMLTMSYAAASREEAESIAKRTVKIVAADDESVSYTLNWLDPNLYADEQADANAMISYDESSGNATVTVSFTDKAVYAHDWKITTGVSAELALYEMQRMASVDSASYAYDSDNRTMSVDWDGYGLDMIDELTVYAVAEDGASYYLYQTADVAAGEVSFELPASLPSGTYTLQIVASSEANNVNCSVSASGSFDYVNPSQPTAPTVDRVALGGDYSIDVDLSEGQNTDGYVITVEEKTSENGEIVWRSTDLGSQWITIEDKDGATVTVGGQYESTVYVDSDGNTVSAEEAESREDVTARTETKGLQAGKTYRLKIVAYNDENGELFSEAIYSSEITMVAPARPTVSVAASGVIVVDGINYINTAEATFNIRSDMAISGAWRLDDGAQKGVFEADTQASLTVGGRPATDDLPAEEGLAEGQHILTLTGTNTGGDAFAVDYVFYVKATSPRLQIATPDAGSFFDETVVVAGLSEPGAKIHVFLDGTEVSSSSVDSTGEFSVSVPMDTTKFEQTVSVYAEDKIGNVSRQYDFKLTNAIVAAADHEIAIYLDGTNYTNSVIPAGASGELALKIVSGGRCVSVPTSSVLGSQAEWSVDIVNGSAELSDGRLTTDGDVNGILKVSFEGHDVAAVLGGNENERIVCAVTLPTDQTGYTLVPLVESTSVIFGGSFLFELDIAEGYTKTDAFAVKVNGALLEPDDNGVYAITDIVENKTVTVEGIADIEAPQIMLSLGEVSWTQFVDDRTFETYFKETQSVSISASDNGSGVGSVYYFVSESSLTLDEVRALSSTMWKAYAAPFDVSPNMNCVIYAMAVDNSGNAVYVSSDGIVLKDSISVSGIEDGKTYEGDLTVTVDDPHLDYVKVDGVDVRLTDGQFTVKADGKSHRIVIADKAGNVLEYDVTVLCIAHVGGSATCTEKGRCEICGEAYIPMIEHQTEIRGAKEATETEEGYTGDTVCKDCGAVISKGEIIPPIGNGGKLSGGAIAGIVVGAAATVAIGGAAIFWFVIKKKNGATL